MKKILVTGASGLLGLNLSLDLAKEYTVTGVIHQDELQGVPYSVKVADLSKPGVSEKIFEETLPDAVIHTAALADVDECEKQPERAELVNGTLPGMMARICRQRSIPLIHISTDAVFDGVKGNYREEDIPNPLSIYARSKLLGEQNVASEYPQAIIARVNFYGWSLRGNRSLAEKFIREMSAGKKVNGFTDVYFCTLHVFQLIGLLKEMLAKKFSGLYHTVSRESISKYAFGVALAREFGLDDCLIEPISVKEAGLAAARSPKPTLNINKLADALGHELPGQSEGYKQFHELFKQGYPAKLHGFLKG
jgi:dTDP-4-dehydrorhamnose reductase